MSLRSCGSIWQRIAITFLSLYPIQRTVPLRPRAPWYKPEVREHKNIRGQFERKWCSNRLLASNIFINVTLLIIWSGQSYYTDIINEDSSDQKILFKTSESYCKNQLTSFSCLLLMTVTLPWQIHLPISLSARLIKYIIGLLKVCGVEFRNVVELTQEKIKIKSSQGNHYLNPVNLILYPRYFWKSILLYFFLLWRSSSICPHRPVLCPMHWK